MEFARASKYTAKVSDIYYVSEAKNFLLVKLELVTPNTIEFFAGQYVSIRANAQGLRRSYSIVSTPDNKHGIQLLAEIIDGGVGSEYLRKLKPGDEVEFVGPLGRFVVEDERSKKLFVATGSGIAPIYSMINDQLLNKGDTEPIRLNWGMRSEQSIFWVDNLNRLAETHANFVFDLVLSQPSEDWELCRGHVQDCLRRDFPSSDLKRWSGYVCGNPTMVEQLVNELAALGMSKDKIHHEKFA